jgi:hypothetical protein
MSVIDAMLLFLTSLSKNSPVFRHEIRDNFMRDHAALGFRLTRGAGGFTKTQANGKFMGDAD